jgi:hypothetical protein
VAAVPLLWVGVRELADRPAVHQVALQLAGGREAACRVLQPGAPGCPVAGDAVRRYRSAVQADGFLLAGWVLAGLGVFGLSALFLSGSGARRVARWCLGGVLLAAAADAGENLALLGGLSGLGGNGGDNTWFAAAASLSVLKFAVGGPLLPVFVVFAGGRGCGAGTAARPRSPRPASSSRGPRGGPTSSCRRRWRTPRRRPSRPPSGTPAPTSSSSCTTSSRRTPARGARRRRRRPPAEVGICASGGGIRSASVTLGALQALREDVLSRARYLVSVSGGGYMAGAFQLALTRANQKADSLAEPGDVFAPRVGRGGPPAAPRQVPGRRRR